MCRDIIYFCAELLNYWSMTFFGLKLFAKVYGLDLHKNKMAENIVFSLLSLSMGMLGAVNYTIVVYSNFLTYVLAFFIWIILYIVNRLNDKKEIKISKSLISLYIFVVRLIDLLVVAVIEETNNVSRHLQFDLVHSGFERTCFIVGLFILYYIIYKVFSKENIILYLGNNKYYRRLLFIYGYIGISCFSIVYRFDYKEQMIRYWTFYLVCAFIFIGTCLFYFIKVKSKEKERLLNMRNDLIEAKYKDLQKVYKENRTMQHDYKNHLLAISELVKENKNEEVLDYIYNYVDYSKNAKKNIQSGNDIVDIIVNSKISESKEKRIKFVYEIDYLGEFIIKDIDICALLANLLDNAIEACEKVIDGDAKIYLKICIRNEILIIRIINSVHPNVIKKKNIFKTEKEDSQLHGWGMHSIENTINKYGGTKEYYIDNSQIEIFVTLPI